MAQIGNIIQTLLALIKHSREELEVEKRVLSCYVLTINDGLLFL